MSNDLQGDVASTQSRGAMLYHVVSKNARTEDRIGRAPASWRLTRRPLLPDSSIIQASQLCVQTFRGLLLRLIDSVYCLDESGLITTAS